MNIHSTRITTNYPFITKDSSGLALYDIILTIIGAIVINFLINKKINFYNVLCITLTLYVLGIILHIIFKVKSPVSNFIVKLVSGKNS